jgi:hypothetical protein
VPFAAETQVSVAVTNNLQIQVFSSDRCQPGDTMEIFGGFASSAFHAYEVVAVAPRHVEFQTSIPIAPQTVLLGSAANLQVYSAAKRVLYVESDQDVAVRLNGDTADVVRVVPWEAGTDGQQGVLLLRGAVWRVVVVNKSITAANTMIITGE